MNQPLPQQESSTGVIGLQEQSDLIRYRSVSRLAVLSGALGVASSMALITPILWFIPLLGIATCLFALAHLRSRADEVTGRKLVLLGLTTAVFFGGFAPARVVARSWMLQSATQTFAEGWLDLLLEGELHKVHQLTLKSDYRLPATASLETFYTDVESAQQELERFVSTPPIQAILDLGSGAKVTASRSKTAYRVQGNWNVIREFTITSTEGKSVTVNILCLRQAIPDSEEVVWSVSNSFLPED